MHDRSVLDDLDEMRVRTLNGSRRVRLPGPDIGPKIDDVRSRLGELHADSIRPPPTPWPQAMTASSTKSRIAKPASLRRDHRAQRRRDLNPLKVGAWNSHEQAVLVNIRAHGDDDTIRCRTQSLDRPGDDQSRSRHLRTAGRRLNFGHHFPEKNIRKAFVLYRSTHRKYSWYFILHLLRNTKTQTKYNDNFFAQNPPSAIKY